MSSKSWGIIGGGIMGMTIAHRLAQQGHKVTLFEAAPSLGGLATAWSLNGFVWDKFYHVILFSDLQTRAMLRELDLEKEIQWVETKTGFYSGGRLYSMSNIFEFLSFPPLNIIDKLRLGLTIFVASRIKNWRSLEKISVEEWLTRWSGKKTFKMIWLPLLKAKLGHRYKDASAAFIWATIQRMYAARKSGLKKEMFGYVKGGYARILETFKNKLLSEGVSIRLNHAASSVQRSSSGMVVSFKSGVKEYFDSAIVTLPSKLTPSLCPDISDDEKARLQNISYLGVICASVVLNRAISPYYVTNITDQWVPFTGVIEMTSLVDRSQFNGKSLIYLPKYVDPGDPMFDMPNEEIENIFLGALKKMYPFISSSDVHFVGISRAKNVFALSTIDYSSNLPPVKTSVKGLYILNSAHITNGTLNVNETIQIAESKLKEILNYE